MIRMKKVALVYLLAHGVIVRQIGGKSTSPTFGNLVGVKAVEIRITRPMIGFKKLTRYKVGDAFAQLVIPVGARVVLPTCIGNKCRASEARVQLICSLHWSQSASAYKYHHRITDKTRVITTSRSAHDTEFKYITGQTVKPKAPFDTTLRDNCRSGIHFFCDLQSALEHVI